MCMCESVLFRFYTCIEVAPSFLGGGGAPGLKLCRCGCANRYPLL